MNERETYYVYFHVCPITSEVKYVGHGWKSRAWVHGGRKTVARSQPHYDWLRDINIKGFLPCDYVKVVERGLSKPDACKLEQRYIRDLSPEFNRPQGLSMLKVTPDILARMRELRGEGLSYKDVGYAVGVAPMTAYRALNGKTKNAK